MAQKLIVEGNDAIALAVLCKKRGLKAPLGYESKEKFSNEFVQNAGGVKGALIALKEALESTAFDNVGLIVDANDLGANGRWQEIRKILDPHFSESTLIKVDADSGAKIIKEENLPKVGIWIMPDNYSTGYLEHFISKLIPADDALWLHSTEVLAELTTKSFCEITKAKNGKAQLHTWLAWKKEPGKPFGQAMDANYFDTKMPVVQEFLYWFSGTFELSP